MLKAGNFFRNGALALSLAFTGSVVGSQTAHPFEGYLPELDDLPPAPNLPVCGKLHTMTLLYVVPEGEDLKAKFFSISAKTQKNTLKRINAERAERDCVPPTYSI